MREYGSRVRKTVRYTQKEAIELLVASLVGGFALSFDKWGYVNFNLIVGLANLITYSVYVLITLAAIDVCRKLYGSYIGVETTFHLLPVGALIAIGFAFLSNGAGAILFLSGFTMKSLAQYQLGRKQQFFRIRDGALIAFYGCIGAFAVGLFFSILAVALPHLVELVKVNILVLIYLLLPFDIIAALFKFSSRVKIKQQPVSLGTALFLGSRTLTVFTITLLVFGYSSILVVGSLWFLILMIFVSAIITGVYYYHKELQ